MYIWYLVLVFIVICAIQCNAMRYYINIIWCILSKYSYAFFFVHSTLTTIFVVVVVVCFLSKSRVFAKNVWLEAIMVGFLVACFLPGIYVLNSKIPTHDKLGPHRGKTLPK